MIEFDGNDDWVNMGDCLNLGTDDISVLALLQYSAAIQPNEWMGTHIGAIVGKGYLDGASRGYGLLVGTNNEIYWQVRNQANEFSVASNSPLNDSRWHLVFGVCDRDDLTGVRLYVDGVRQAVTANATVLNGIELNGSRSFAIGSRQEEASGTWYWDFLGNIAMVCVWKRVLAEAEIRQLQQDPFRMFASRQAISMFLPAPGITIQCAGSIQAVTSASATARVVRDVVGVTGTSASVDATLTARGVMSLSANVYGWSVLHAVLLAAAPRVVFSATLQTRMPWQRETLFNGVTHTALGLGTALTQGWFWTRRRGCTAVYRGSDIVQVNLSRILHVAEPNVQDIPLPVYLSHAAESTYCYLARRFSRCGHQEKTMAAATLLAIASDGQLARAHPNTIVGVAGEQIEATCMRLVWFYSPLNQKTAPRRFSVYQDGPVGEMNLGTPIGTVPHRGRRSYCFHVADLAPRTYTFVVRAASADDVEDLYSTALVHHRAASLPESAVILIAKSV